MLIAFLTTRVRAPDKDDWHEVGPSDEISERHAHAAADSQRQRKRHLKVVGGRIICSPS